MTHDLEHDAAHGWAFDRFRLIVGRGLFDADGGEIPIAPKPLAVLVHLLRNRDRTVDRAELLEQVWRGVSVSDAALSSVLRDLRRALGDAASDARILRTVRGRGLTLAVDVDVEEIAPDDASSRWDETEEHLQRALRALELVERTRGLARDSAERARADLLVALARVQWAGGSTGSAREIFAEAAALGRAIGDAPILARAALGYAGRTDVPTRLANEVLALLEEALDVVPKDEAILASEVRARLATELAIGSNVERATQLTDEALAIAKKSRDPGAIAYALTARHFVLQRTDVPLDERITASLAAQAEVSGRPPSDVLALALQQELIDRLEAGQRERFDEVLGLYEATVASLGQPFFDWMHAVFSGIPLLIDGDLEAAEARAAEAHALGERAGSPNASLAFFAQLFAIRRDQGRLTELLPALDALPAAFRERRAIRAARAAIVAESDDAEAARLALDHATGGSIEAVPRDHEWSTTMGLLAPVVARAGSDADRQAMRNLLAPYADRIFVFAHGVAIAGAVSHAMGLLSRSLGLETEAAADFARSRAMHDRLGARLWLDRDAVEARAR